MLPYAAYLRVYEPVTAFPEPLRSVWTAYAESGRRPRRANALDVEHGEAVRRLVSVPPVVAPDVESPHAYVRRTGDMIYICPWETRLRSWLAFSRFQGVLPPGVTETFVPRPLADRVEGDFERWKLGGRPLRPHIISSTWHVPLPWFVPFDSAERFLSLGVQADRAPDGSAAVGRGRDGGRPEGPEHVGGPGLSGPEGPAGAVPARTLIYVTSMRQARGRVDRALRAVPSGLGAGHLGHGLATGQIEIVARWLAGFSPGALVELDYGGLVHLVGDDGLRADESVAEVAVAVAAMERDEVELAVAMYKRLLSRWRSVQALEAAN